jgi:hypothetical protein
MHNLTRRTFLATAPLATLALRTQTGGAEPVPDSFPSHPPALVREMVTVAHGNVARVTELVAARPALARAAWDWGYGDWETALGAASHVGNREIGGILLANGAHPTIFSAAMLGQLEVVRMFVTASPGIQRTRGPHGLTLLSHAKAGGAAAAGVVSYLESIGGADSGYPNEALDEQAMKELTGTYTFGPGTGDRMVVSINARGGLVIKRDGPAPLDRNLFHHGGRVFNPAGAEAVRIRFEPLTGPAASVTIEDGPARVMARRAI